MSTSRGLPLWELKVHRGMADDFKAYTRHVTRLLVEAGQVRPRPAACERCGREVALHCHHLDYFDPASVAYLCPRCHSAAHRSVRTWQARWDEADHAA